MYNTKMINMTNIKQFVKKYKWILLILVVAGVVLYFNMQSARAKAKEEVYEKPQKQTIANTLELTGHVDAVEKVDLKFIAPSRLAWVGVKEGDTVKKWQGIASVDTRTLQKQLEQDLNTFNKAFRNHDQVLDDNDYYGDSGVSSELKRVFENSNFDLNSAVATVEIRDLAIKMSSIYSPFAGIVTRVDQPNAGVNIGVTDVFQVVNPNTLYFAAEVDELDVSRISLGQKAQIVLDAYTESPIESTIVKIGFSPVGGTSSGTSYKVELSLPGNNDALKYRLGMSGDARIVLEQKDGAMTIPSSALIERDDKFFVDVKTSAKEPERKEVTIGIESDDLVEITSGLNESDEVVIPQ